jgi:hypothetical protein
MLGLLHVYQAMPRTNDSLQSTATAHSALTRNEIRRLMGPVGGYLEHITNTLADGVRTGTLARTLQVRDGLLIDTITNDLTYNTLVPRLRWWPGSCGWTNTSWSSASRTTTKSQMSCTKDKG